MNWLSNSRKRHHCYLCCIRFHCNGSIKMIKIVTRSYHMDRFILNIRFVTKTKITKIVNIGKNAFRFLTTWTEYLKSLFKNYITRQSKVIFLLWLWNPKAKQIAKKTFFCNTIVEQVAKIYIFWLYKLINVNFCLLLSFKVKSLPISLHNKP